MTIEQVLSEFIDAWNAGRRPQVDDYLARVAPAERDALAESLAGWLAVAPAPAYDEAALDAIRAEPPLRAVREAAAREAGLLPVLVPRLRARRGLGIGELARRVAAAVALPGQEERTADYLQRLERGELDGSRLSRRLLRALADALGTSAGVLADAASLGAGVRTAGATLWRADDAGAWVAEDIDTLSRALMAPAPEPLDELDRLFVGGPDA